MKKYSILLLACLTVATTQAQTQYRKTYDSSKQPSVEGTLNEAGRRTGSWTWWYPNGQVSQQGTYNAGQKTGTWVLYYDDGSKMAEECHTTGISRSWHRNGDLKSEVAVENGKKNGTYRSWYANGQQEEELIYRNGSREGQTTQWHENGKVKFKGLYKDNELQGNATWWTPQGFKDMEGNMVNGEQDGKWTFYWRTNGKIGIQGTYAGGKEIGRWTYFYETGERWREATTAPASAKAFGLPGTKAATSCTKANMPTTSRTAAGPPGTRTGRLTITATSTKA